MAKVKKAWFCTSCGNESAKWLGKCPSCNTWNTFVEEIVQKMEKGDLSLEESLKFFEEGVKLSRDCHGQLTQAELQVKKLVSVDENGKVITEKFSAED